MNILKAFAPQPLWEYFESICQVPRASKKEKRIRKFLIDFAERNHFPVKTDLAGNVLISKHAAKGREKAPVIVLQTHMDMVCEKNTGKIHDFDNQPIEYFVEGDWVKANGTTLGADCGVGMAAQLALLTSRSINHGPLECLFTVDEETGLTGASALERGFIKGNILLNLDSEDEGEIFIGCAGGIDTVATFQYEKQAVPAGFVTLKISVGGLLGGHSGDDIHKGRGNANKILARFLKRINLTVEFCLSGFNGGNLRNAIAREASAVILVPEGSDIIVRNEFDQFVSQLQFEYLNTDPDIAFKLEETGLPDYIIDNKTQELLINALISCPHGVIEMSSRMEGMVETSTNLASIKPGEGNKIVVTTSQRSEIESRKIMVAEMVASVFNLAGAEIIHSDGYPGWAPDPESEILKLTVQSYRKLFGTDPLVKSIHAGLECGLFKDKFPYLDMVSFGPTIKGAHSPSEKVSISATQKFWKHLVDILENV